MLSADTLAAVSLGAAAIISIEIGVKNVEDDEVVSKVKHRIKFSGSLGLGWFFFLGVVFLIAYDSEIRCSMGNKIECAKFEPKQK